MTYSYVSNIALIKKNKIMKMLQKDKMVIVKSVKLSAQILEDLKAFNEANGTNTSQIIKKGIQMFLNSNSK